MKTFCFDSQTKWDNGVRMLLFALREAFQEYIGFSPFELVCGHSVGSPLKILKQSVQSISLQEDVK